ncbi:MAG: hydroxyphenylacetyl-CoA thioesterase PaaI [Aliishimia sp.]
MKHNMSNLSPQERANKCAQIMFANDTASQGLGMQLDEIAPGRAVLSMQIRSDMLNGHRIAHGGFIFTLADSAFAFACNSYNRITVAQQNQITYVAPGKDGETLIATATETTSTGRSGTYDVVVTGESGRTIALMRGLSRTVKGTHFDEEDTQ